MNNAKYINTIRGPIIFSTNWNHSDFKPVLESIGLEPSSAGQFSIEDGMVYVCPGGSMSLGVSANQKSDAEDIAMLLGLTPLP